MSALDQLIADLDALEDRATPGTWFAQETSRGTDVERLPSGASDDEGELVARCVDGDADDGQLIAALRNAWPQLRAAITALQGQAAGAQTAARIALEERDAAREALAVETRNANAYAHERDAARAEADALRAEDARATEYMREMLRKVDEESGQIAVCSWCALPTLSDAETKRAHQETCPENPMRISRDAARSELAEVKAAIAAESEERAPVDERLHAAEEELRALKATVGEFCDWSTRRWLVRGAELKRRAFVMLAAIRGAR